MRNVVINKKITGTTAAGSMPNLTYVIVVSYTKFIELRLLCSVHNKLQFNDDLCTAIVKYSHYTIRTALTFIFNMVIIIIHVSCSTVNTK